jgi:hypothetical protein
MLFSFREDPATGGLCRIILDLNFDQRPIPQDQTGAWIRHDLPFGIVAQTRAGRSCFVRLCGGREGA